MKTLISALIIYLIIQHSTGNRIHLNCSFFAHLHTLFILLKMCLDSLFFICRSDEYWIGLHHDDVTSNWQWSNCKALTEDNWSIDITDVNNTECVFADVTQDHTWQRTDCGSSINMTLCNRPLHSELRFRNNRFWNQFSQYDSL